MKRYYSLGSALLLTAAAEQLYPFASIITQDPLPECTTQVLCNADFCADVCVEGSVVVDPWFDSAIRFQMGLQDTRPLPGFQFVGTHNSFISRANGMGLTEDFGASLFARTLPSNLTTLRVSDQRYAVTDLLNMGVRHIEADIWSLDVVAGRAHICHSPVADPLYVTQLQVSADALGYGEVFVNPFSELCSNITFAMAMGKIVSWLQEPRNAQEIVVVFLDNRVPDYNIETVVTDLQAVFGPMMLTPLEFQAMFGSRWPSRGQLISAGKRIIVESNSYNPNNYTGTNLTNVAFYPTLFSEFQIDPVDVSPFPNCTISGSSVDWYGNNWVRVLEGEVVWAPDSYDERQSGGVMFKPNGIADMLACGVGNIGVSEYGPHVLPGLIWSWLPSEPSVTKAAKRASVLGFDSTSNCTAAAITTVRGRWSAMPCEAALPAVCRYGNTTVPAGNNFAAWNLTAPLPFAGAASACASLGAGWAFDLPRDARENAVIMSLAQFSRVWQESPGVWLNHQVS